MNSTQTFSLPVDMDVDSTSSIEHIERTFCTNFSCCNILLPDLHALLDHLELSTSGGHTTIPSSPAGHRSPSSLSSPATSPPSTPGFHGSSSTPSSPIHPLPHFLTLSPAKHQFQDDINAGGAVGVGVDVHIQLPIPSIGDHYYHPDAYALAEYPTYEHCFHAAIASPPSSSITDFANCVPSSSSSSPSPPPLPASCSPPSKRKNGPLPPPPRLPKKQKTSTTKRSRGRPDAELAAAGKTGRRSRKAYQCPVRLHFLSFFPFPSLALSFPSLFLFPFSRSSPSSSAPLALPFSLFPFPFSRSSLFPPLALPLSLLSHFLFLFLFSRTSSFPSLPLPLSVPSSRSVLILIVSFRFSQTPGCTKSYLNPNGLKYHQEKGTCKIEGEERGVVGVGVGVGVGKGGGKGKGKGKGWRGRPSATHAPAKFEFGYLHPPHYPTASSCNAIDQQLNEQHQNQQTQIPGPMPYIYQPQPRHWEGAGAVFGLDADVGGVVGVGGGDGGVNVGVGVGVGVNGDGDGGGGGGGGGEVEEDVYGYGYEVESYSVSVAHGAVYA
ncbi:hypothetical protein Hypma_014970 [Hypsizygus marmoreus]|uniref:Uncharacterized protein n=1 Tax=Hypsizygus marmoreus TaxID=39966 RepID=A0A369K8M7_HYPMA|nr:hypothetical protein Hypma_014970 [Hypsizygus marmoreus]